MEGGLTEDEILEQIALKITKNQVEYESKTEEEKKELEPKVNMVAESQLGELKKDFNSILSAIDSTITPEIRLTILQGISDRVMKEGVNSISEVFTTSEVINYVNNVVISEEKRYQEIKHIENTVAVSYVASEMESNFLNDIESGENWKFRNNQLAELFSFESGVGDVKKLSTSERKLIDVVDKQYERIESLIAEANSPDPQISHRAKTILAVSSTVIGFADIDKDYFECSKIEKENALHGIFHLGRIVEETGDEFSTELLEDLVKTLGFKNIVEKDENGNVKVDFDYIQEFAKKEGFLIGKNSPKIMDEEHWTMGFENYSSAKDFMETSIIQKRKKVMVAEVSVLSSLLEKGNITLDEAKDGIDKAISTNIDAANQMLFNIDSKEPNTPEGELYNYTIQAILKQYLDSPQKYKIDNYVMGDLIEGIGRIKDRDLQKLDAETLDLMGKVTQKNMIMLTGSQKDVSYNKEQYNAYRQIYISVKEQIQKNNNKSESKIEFLKELEYDDLKRYVEQFTKDEGFEKFSDFSTNLLNSKYPKKETYIMATLDFLAEQKDTDEFSTEESKTFRQELFESIVLSGVTEPEIFEKMKELDRDSSKEVLKMMIEQVNSSRIALNKVVGSLQELGKNLNEPVQENMIEDKDLGFLDANNAKLPYVNMFENKDDEGR